MNILVTVDAIHATRGLDAAIEELDRHSGLPFFHDSILGRHAHALRCQQKVEQFEQAVEAAEKDAAYWRGR